MSILSHKAFLALAATIGCALAVAAPAYAEDQAAAPGVSFKVRGASDRLEMTVNGSRVVSPTQTTTYTLTATGADGRSVSAPVIVTVSGGQTARILSSLL